jgi:putative acetyltransferase
MSYSIRKVRADDSPKLSHLIRTVMPEFGANGPGFAIHDEEVSDIFKAYTQSRTIYFVCEEDGKILGGGGIAPCREEMLLSVN